MGQLLLPVFPENTKMITPILGVYTRDGEVYYLLSGMPIYSHDENDIKMFRYVTSNMLLKGLCKNRDIERVFEVSSQSVKRFKKILAERGEDGFFADARKGTCYKLTPKVLQRIQIELNKGRTNSSIAKEEGLSEGSIRHAIKTGKLIKKKR